jgi:hypothetical protein
MRLENRQWGTYYGGAGEDIGYSVTRGLSGDIYLAGITDSLSSTTSIIASPGCQQLGYRGGAYDGFIVKFFDDTSTTTQSSLTDESHIIVYPNPNNGIVQVKAKDLENNSVIEVYNSLRQRIKIQKFDNEITTIDLSKETSGVYYLKISSKNSEKSFKLMKL